MARIVVLGGGESGCGSAVLAKAKGFDVFLSDKGEIAPEYKEMLAKWGIDYEEGGHTEALVLSADRVVKSPGIPDTVPVVKALRERGIPVISEIEFAGAYTDAKTICITGSNGKTTTTTLIYEILRRAGMNVGLAGNIGESFALAVATRSYDWYVIELSSFQLDGMFDFRADIGILMNITPDHLDRYEYKMQNYTESKFRIVRNQRPGDRFIYCADDPVIAGNLSKYALPMGRLPFSVKRREEPGAWLDGTAITVQTGGGSLRIDTSELQIRGIHNTYNALAASLAALSAGVDAASIAETLRSFAGVEHRLEPAGEIGGVEYINDSKATNVDSVWYALESMTRPVVWIAGGTDKGNDYGQLDALVAQKVKTLVCMGADNRKLLDYYKDKAGKAGPLTVADTHSLEEAMAAARASAAPGDTVLLSPACASFDLFENYEHRGRLFKDWVARRREDA